MAKASVLQSGMYPQTAHLKSCLWLGSKVTGTALGPAWHAPTLEMPVSAWHVLEAIS